MRIDSTYTSGYSSLYNILNKTQNVSTSESESSTINYSAVGALSNESVGSISSGMNSEAMAMRMKLRTSSEDETSKANHEQMKALMDQLAETDLESLDETDKRALLDELDTAFAAVTGQTSTIDNSSLTLEEVDQKLSDIQAKAIEGPKGPGGPGGPGGTTSTEEDDEVSSLEAMLEALYGSEEDEDTDTTETDAVTEATRFKAAIEQYMKTQNWTEDDLKSILEI